MDTKQDMKRVFYAMPREDQIKALYDMLTGDEEDFRSRFANREKWEIETANKLEFLEGEITGIGRRRDPPSISTSQKIEKAFNKRFEFWTPIFRDVLKDIIRAIVFITIYMLAKQIVLAGHFP